MEIKTTASSKIHFSLHHKLKQQVIIDGYGMKGKSLWITEAIESFLLLSDYPDLVDIASQTTTSLTDVISLRIPLKLMDKIESAVIEIRRCYPAMEGVKSHIIRASIIQRLIRTSVTEVV